MGPCRSFPPCPLWPEGRSPGGKKGVADQKVRKKDAGLRAGEAEQPWSGYFLLPGLTCSIHTMGLVTHNLIPGAGTKWGLALPLKSMLEGARALIQLQKALDSEWPSKGSGP